MSKKQIRISKEHCEEIMDTLGNVENGIEFIDLNKDDLEAKKGYAGLINRCDEIEKRICKFQNLCKQNKLKNYTFSNYEEFRSNLKKDQSFRKAYRTDYFDILENEILNEEKELDIFIENKSQNLYRLNSLLERREVLKIIGVLTQFDKDYIELEEKNEINSNISLEEGKEASLKFIAGVILSEHELKLRRTVFRVSYGLAMVSFWDLNENNFNYINQNFTTNLGPKKIFTILIKNSENSSNYLLGKLIKICDALSATRYSVPPRLSITSVIEEINREITRMQTLLEEIIFSIKSQIENKTGTKTQPGKYTLYRLYFKKQREIYSNLAKCRSTNSFVDGQIWVLENKMQEISDALTNTVNTSSNSVGANIISLENNFNIFSPPTFIDTNEFIWPFQEIVDTYGIPRYQEINPTIFNIVTFPFLFGIMFGDIGHGFCLLILAGYLCYYAEEIKKQKHSIFKPALQGRYLLLLMGFFSFYCGWIYNEFFSLSLPVFGGSCYDKKKYLNKFVYEAGRKAGCVYPIGMDPIWMISKNELSFNNSFKMKLSVIVGVFHMLFGIVLKGINCLHFKNMLGFCFEFIPQIIFMLILFGYMDLMIVIKWMTTFSDTSQAPSLIAQLMNIFLKLGSIDHKPLWEDKNNRNIYFQEKLHFVILIISLFCVPIMLFPKPIIEYIKTSRRSGNYINLSDERELKEEENENDIKIINIDHHEEHNVADIFVHQTIETIEFVLGAVSNTASYLRLWALSLAHGQLARVFFEKTVASFYLSENVPLAILQLTIGFFIFANITIAVLMCMDLLECFLHTLRLHW